MFLDSVSFHLLLLLIIIMIASRNVIIQFIVRIVLEGAANGRITPKEAVLCIALTLFVLLTAKTT